MLRLDFDFGPLIKKIDGMEVAINKSIRPAAFAGSKVFYDEVRMRALTIGGSTRLQAAVYQKFVITDAKDAIGESATYHISWRKQRAKTNIKAAANPDAGLPYSTIGFWIEFGWWQRYMAKTNEDGDWYTVAKPFKKKADKPGRYASQKQKDAYWMPRTGGPVFHPAKSFLRSSYEARKNDAAQAAQARMKQLLKEAGF